MTYYDWQITHSEVMSWVSRQAGIPIHQRDSRVGSLSEFTEFWQSSRTRLDYSSENSVKSEWIPAEIPRLSYFEDSRQAGKSSGLQNLSSLSTLQRMNLGALYEAKPHFLHTFYKEEYGGIYRGVKSVLWPKVGLGGPTCQASRPSFIGAPTLGIGYPVH
jgi:hypothetical protein